MLPRRDPAEVIARCPPESMMESRYPSKQDAWLRAVVLLSALSTALAGLTAWMQPGNLLMRFAVSALCLLGTVFFIDLLMRTGYTLGREGVSVRSGIFRWEIPYSVIESVRPSRSWLSGPALSLDRLAITRRDSSLPLIISPREASRFLAELADRDPGLKFLDGTIQRQAI